jgi:hypothetical protein
VGRKRGSWTVLSPDACRPPASPAAPPTSWRHPPAMSIFATRRRRRTPALVAFASYNGQFASSSAVNANELGAKSLGVLRDLDWQTPAERLDQHLVASTG